MLPLFSGTSQLVIHESVQLLLKYLQENLKLHPRGDLIQLTAISVCASPDSDRQHLISLFCSRSTGRKN
jgi:hypothetical protein